MAFSVLFGVLALLKESVRLIARRKLAMTIIATISILFDFLILFAHILFIKPALSKFVRKGTFLLLRNPQGSQFLGLLLQVKHDAWVLWAIVSVVFFIAFILSLFPTVSIILVISTSYKGKSISFHTLIYRLASLVFKPFITSLHIKMYSVGYMFSVFAILALVLFSVNTTLAFKAIATILVCSIAVLFWIHLRVVWAMGLVVSVIQDNCYGIEALGKASRLVDGKRLNGYLLNFISILSSVSVFKFSMMFVTAKSVSAQILFALFWSVFSCVMQVFLYSAYTVFYFQCKGKGSEEVELKESSEYIKLPGDIP